MKDNGTDMAEIKSQVDEMLDSVRMINHRIDNLMNIVSSLDEDVITSKHSITQELIDEGAFDVAKAYIDFLKARANRPLTVDKLTVSPTGKKTMKENNVADFGPDTKGTKTSGIQEAIDKAAEKHKEEVPKDDDTGN